MTDTQKEDSIELISQVIKRNIVDDMFDEGYIPKIYNGCHGGRRMSNKAKSLVKSIYKEFEDNKEFEKYGEMKQRLLSEFIKAKVILFLGKEANCSYSSLVFDFVRIDLFMFVEIEEYDGLESLSFDEDSYLSHTMKSILKDTNINNDEKILKMNVLVDTKIDNVIVDFEDVENREVKKILAILSI